MPDVMEINGTDEANTLTGTDGADLIYGFDPNGPQADVAAIDATRVATGLTQPVFITAAPNDEGRLFIVEKGGLIKILDLRTGTVEATPFLDVSGEIETAGEQGLLGLTFHPDFAQNGKFYVNMSAKDGTAPVGDTLIREYTVSGTDPNLADPSSARSIIRIDQPEDRQNHKAGWIGFGPDGYLYVPTGDGGGGGDPDENAQNPDSLLGKVLRLDVDRDAFADPDRNYAIPADNPFAGPQAGADEIWALGLRNPFRNSFDRGTGELFIADVGQNRWEEVNLGEAGANYRWDAFEGPDPYTGPTGDPSAPLPPGAVTFPIHAYNHDAGDRSITGGYVYRGSSDGLHGQYFFADFVSDRIWSLRQNQAGEWVRTDRTAQLRDDSGIEVQIFNPSSFGEDAEGNLYVVSLGQFTSTGSYVPNSGNIFRLDPQVASADQGDTIDAGAGDDAVYAGAGADTVSGGAGDDRLHGMAGNDNLAGGTGADALYGGVGRDAASYAAAAAGVAASLVNERANRGEAAGDSFAGIENLIGSRFGDRLFGDGGRNALAGLSGNDTLVGGGGADVIGGGRGADVLLGGLGADTFRFVMPEDLTASARDAVRDFSRAQGDRLDVSRIDADAATAADDAFAVRATLAEARGSAGSIYVGGEGSARVAFLNIDADADFEAAILVNGVTGLGAEDFIL